MSEIDAALWREYFGDGDPFLSWDFLHGLEASGCTTTESGWQPAHLSIELSGEPAGMMPTYLKTHSYGEYVFDWSWADAWQRMGLRYYPKLVTAVPFTPATGQRLGHVDHHNIRAPAIVEAVKGLTDSLGVSSWHVLFLDEVSSTQL